MTARAFAAPRAGRRPATRSARLLTARRLLAAFGLLASAAALYGVTSSPAFELERVEVAGAGHTSPDQIRELVRDAIGERPNLFRVRTTRIADALQALPVVRTATARIGLPDRLVVTVIERQPILVLQTPNERFLVDVEGRLFLADPSPADAAGLPLIRDRRERAREFPVGGWLDAVDLAAVRQLGALKPAVLGSRARTFELTVDDENGWVLHAPSAAWRAVFGFYTSRTRSPELIPAQVQCLRAIVGASEKQLATVYLGRPGERCGTFKPRPSPR